MSNSPTPLVSFILVAYNQENLITEAVESLLSQTYSPLEIILSDDCSSDSTFTIMKSLKDSYKGPHKIKLNHNKTNLGISAHINKLVALTHGDLVFCAAGDDISLPERCSEVVSFWLEHKKQADLIATDAYDMAFNGKLLGLKKTSPLDRWKSAEDWFDQPPYILGANHTWSRNLINRFSTLNSKIRGEDQVMTFRAILTGSAMTLEKPLVKHRRKDKREKIKELNAQSKRQAIINGNINSKASIQQHITDAEIVEQKKIVASAFKRTIAYDRMVSDLFEETSFTNKLKTLIKYKEFSIAKRVRLFIYASCPSIMTPYFTIKSKLTK